MTPRPQVQRFTERNAHVRGPRRLLLVVILAALLAGFLSLSSFAPADQAQAATKDTGWVNATDISTPAANPGKSVCLNSSEALAAGDGYASCLDGQIFYAAGFDFSAVPEHATNIRFAVRYSLRASAPAPFSNHLVKPRLSGNRNVSTTALPELIVTNSGPFVDYLQPSDGCSDFNRPIPWSRDELAPDRFLSRITGGPVGGHEIHIDHVQVKVCWDEPALPDLTMSLANDAPAGGVTDGENWLWTARIGNEATASALFASGETLFAISLPPALSYEVHTEPEGTACAIAANVFACTASSALTLPADSALEASVRATAPLDVVGEMTAGSSRCVADPDGKVAESVENNNQCAPDTVTVTPRPLPDLTLHAWVSLPANDDHLAQLATLTTYALHIELRNDGTAPAAFPAGARVFHADLPLPAAGVTVTVVGANGVDCLTSAPAAALVCTALAGGATVDPGGSVRLTLIFTTGYGGVFVMPGDGGECTVDPDVLVSESDDANNECDLSLPVIELFGDAAITLDLDWNGIVSDPTHSFEVCLVRDGDAHTQCENTTATTPQVDFLGIFAGPYTVNLVAPAGWSGPSTPPTITVAEGPPSSLTLSLVHAPPGDATLVVRHVVTNFVGDTTQFELLLDGDEVGEVSAVVDATLALPIADEPASFELTLTGRDHYRSLGWALAVDDQCPAVPSEPSATATVALGSSGSAVLCFYSEALGSITIRNSDPAGLGPWRFAIAGPVPIAEQKLPVGTPALEMSVDIPEVPLGGPYIVTLLNGSALGSCPAPNSDPTLFLSRQTSGEGGLTLMVPGEVLEFVFEQTPCPLVAASTPTPTLPADTPTPVTPSPTPTTPSPTPAAPSPTPATPSPTPRTSSPTPATPSLTPATPPPTPTTPSPTPAASSPAPPTATPTPAKDSPTPRQTAPPPSVPSPTSPATSTPTAPGATTTPPATFTPSALTPTPSHTPAPGSPTPEPPSPSPTTTPASAVAGDGAPGAPTATNTPVAPRTGTGSTEGPPTSPLLLLATTLALTGLLFATLHRNR